MKSRTSGLAVTIRIGPAPSAARGMTDVVIAKHTKQKCEAAMAVEALDPGAPTKVGGHHVTGSTDPARDSSLKDR